MTATQLIYNGYDSSYNYTVPDDGWFRIYVTSEDSSSVVQFYINNILVDSVQNRDDSFILPIRKGAVISFTQSGNSRAAALYKLITN